MFKQLLSLNALVLIFNASSALASAQVIQKINCFTIGQPISQSIQLFLVSPANTLTWTDDSGAQVSAQQYTEALAVVKKISPGSQISLSGYDISNGDFPRGHDVSYAQNSGATMYVLEPTASGLSPDGPAQLKIELSVPNDNSQTSSLVITSESFDPVTTGTKVTQLMNINGMMCTSYSSNSDEFGEAKQLVSPR